jgi:hypothetical protein
LKTELTARLGEPNQEEPAHTEEEPNGGASGEDGTGEQEARQLGCGTETRLPQLKKKINHRTAAARRREPATPQDRIRTGGGATRRKSATLLWANEERGQRRNLVRGGVPVGDDPESPTLARKK